MSTNPRITVGIPAYKAQNTILRTLSSIATQDILEDLDVVICNDADGNKSMVKYFFDKCGSWLKTVEYNPESLI